MDKRRITVSDIVLGEPLPWDVYDTENRLLLRKGQVIALEQQIRTLVERGLFLKAAPDIKSADGNARMAERPSVVRLIDLATRRLERLLFGLPNEPSLQSRLLEVAKVIRFAADTNVDIALACLLLHQDRSCYAIRHSVDAALVALVAARSLDKPQTEIDSIMGAALTMNVGMLRQHEQLQHRANSLGAEEQQIIRRHPEQSAALLREAGITDETWLACVLLHHENDDGSGYPFGKKADAIPENARIVALADRYCARISSRSYRKPLLPNAALHDILVMEKDRIDPQLVAHFIKALGVYPTGTYVRLADGEIGIVTGKGKTTTTPYVHALVGPRGVALSFPIRRDTSLPLHAIRDVLPPEQAAVRCTMQHLWGNEAAP